MTHPTTVPAPSAAVRWAIRLLAGAAAALCVVLLADWLSRGGASLPGCGAASDCETVLSSPWAMAAGVPVSAPALVVYIAAVAAALHIGPRAPERRRQAAWGALLFFATAAGAGAVYFLAVQALALGVWCRYCTAIHALGLALLVLTWWAAPVQRVGRGTATGLAALAVAGVALLAGMQWAFPTPTARVEQTGIQAPPVDTGPGADRVVSLLGGKVRLSPHEYPILGNPDAPVILAELFDYTCPHCRRLHGLLEEARQRYGERLAVVMLVAPLDAECNFLVEETEPRFETACELAKLSLAVHQAAPAKFPSYHAWLMAGEAPPTPDEAEAHAAELIGAEALRAAQADARAAAHIRRNVQLHALTAGSLPQILGPSSIIYGRPRTAEELFGLLEENAALQSPASGTEGVATDENG